MFGTESFILFFLVTLVTYLIVHRWRQQRFYELAHKLPGHDGLSIYQSIKYILTVHRKDYIAVFKSYIKDDAEITKVWLANCFLLLTKSPEIIHKVFNMPQTYDKPNIFYQVFMVKNGLISLNGSDHKRHRKILNKSFSPKMLQRLPEIFDEKSKKILKKMEVELGNGTFDVVDYAGAFTLDALTKSNFNHDVDSYKTKLYETHEQKLSNPAFKLPLAVLLPSKVWTFQAMVEALPFLCAGVSKKILRWTKFGRKIDEIFEAFGSYLNQITRENLKTPEVEENTIMNLLLDPKNGFSDEDILDEFMVISVAGFETSARTSSIALMMLGIHKEIQELVVQEINQIFSTETNTSYTLEFLQKFTYLEAVIKETLRLYPVAPLILREVTEEVDVNGYLIPKGAFFLMVIDAMHRDEKSWGPDAHLFRPERFLTELKNPKAFAPFAGGKRICIGYRYAMISMKIFLINFLRTYKVDCPIKYEDIQTEITLTLNIVNGYKISIQKR